MQEDSLIYYYLNNTIEKEKLYFEEYFSEKYSSSAFLFANDSTVTTATLSRPELKHEEISRQPETFDWVFGIFLICFIFFSNIFGKKMQVLPSTIGEIFYIKKSESIFSKPTTNEWYGKLFLCFQTCLLLALFLCKYYTYTSTSNTILDSPVKTIIFVLLITFMLCVFFFLKWVTCYFVGLVFFDKLSLQTWAGNFFSLLAFSGIFLFIPVLLYFYTNTPHNFFFYAVLIYMVFFEILVIYKSIVLFFYKRSLLLHLFLYLCAQEIIPLFFLWKIMICVFNNFVEKSALWL